MGPRRRTPNRLDILAVQPIHRHEQYRRNHMDNPSPLLAGTLDLLILKTLSIGSMHGYAIAQHIHRLSNDALRVEEGSLYPALQRMQVKGWLASETKKSPTGRQARYYRLTVAGRKQLVAEEKAFRASVSATTLVLEGTKP